MPPRISAAAFLLILGSLAAAACGQPLTSPSSFSQAAGATISGTVTGPTTSSIPAIAPPPSRVASSVPSGLTVTVGGTNLTVPVDAAGRFDLANVPPGTVELRFNGPGINAAVTLTGVGVQQLIELHVSLTGPTEAVVAEVRASPKSG